MTLLEINPLSPLTAVSEIVLLLAGAALIGYGLGRWMTNSRIQRLRTLLTEREAALSDCTAKREALSAPAAAVAPDNLRLIEGIGPKIEALLHTKGVYQFRQLAQTDAHTLTQWLQEAGPRFQIHSPVTWPQQAALARDDQWEELEALQARLSGGRPE